MRLPILQVGVVEARADGTTLIDRWQFATPAGAPGVEAITAPDAEGRVGGWSLAELHLIAHGEQCSCLSS